jgi:hypothetical protein
MVGGSLGTLASSTTKAGRHDIAEILLKVMLNTKIQFKFNTKSTVRIEFWCLTSLSAIFQLYHGDQF